MSQNIQKNNIVQLNTIPKKLIRLFSKAIAKLLLKFNISKHDYNHFLNEQLILEAKKQNPKASKVELSVRTGIDRRFIGDYLKGDMANIKSSKLSLILSDIKWTLKKYYEGGNKLPKRGPFKSFESICQQWSSGTLTYKAVLNELVRIGSIVDHGDKVELIDAKESDVKNSIQAFDITSTLLSRYSKTIIENMDDIDDALKYYQMSALSTQIAPEDINQIKIELRILLKKQFTEIIHILEKYECDVSPETYPAYGVSVFEFKDQ